MRIVIFIFLCVLAGPLLAHESRPLFIDIQEQPDQQFLIKWRVPLSVPRQNNPLVILDACSFTETPIMRDSGQLRETFLQFDCSDVTKLAISITYPMANPSLASLLRVHWQNRENRSFTLPPGQKTFRLPPPEEAGRVSIEYLALGGRHIWGGYDHLLFIACMMLIAGSFWRIIICASGFTLAHSVTLILATMGAINIPLAAVEAMIALSIAFLAREIILNRRTTLTWRYPIAVATLFGLLHGFGFASALLAIGLPQTEIPLALLFFNIGVELGQIAFITSVFIAFKAVEYVARSINFDNAHSLAILRYSGASVAGVIASFWFFERIII